MAETSNISWTDSTFNPWEGCQKVGPGCDNCYAENRNARFAGGQAINWGPGAPRRRMSFGSWRKPKTWNSQHAAFFAEHGRRRRVFCASLADWLDLDVHIRDFVDLLELVRVTTNLDWQLLTKRIGNWRKRLQEAADWIAEPSQSEQFKELGQWLDNWLKGKPPENVLIGATVVNQEEAERDIPKLLSVPAAQRFLSMEPLLGLVNLTSFRVPNRILRNMVPAIDRLDWIIVGGESGPGARPMELGWAIHLRDQCHEAGVAFFMKQMGGAKDKKDDLSALPEELRIRQFPGEAHVA